MIIPHTFGEWWFKCIRPTCCSSFAAEARSTRWLQKSHDLARRRGSTASACWAGTLFGYMSSNISGVLLESEWVKETVSLLWKVAVDIAAMQEPHNRHRVVLHQ